MLEVFDDQKHARETDFYAIPELNSLDDRGPLQGAATVRSRSVTRRHQVAQGCPGLIARHQTLADEHVAGATTGIGEQVVRATDSRLGHPERVRRQAGGDPAESRAIDLESVKSRAFTLMRRAPASTAWAASSSVYTSTSAVIPSDSMWPSREPRVRCSSAATMSSTRSAPCPTR